MIISQALKDVLELEKKIKRGEAILTYWRQWLIDYRKQHPKVEVNQEYDRPRAVEPESMSGQDLASLRKHLELTQREMAFKLGITRRQFSRLETGKCAISNKIMSKVRGHLVNGNTYLLE